MTFNYLARTFQVKAIVIMAIGIVTYLYNPVLCAGIVIGIIISAFF